MTRTAGKPATDPALAHWDCAASAAIKALAAVCRIDLTPSPEPSHVSVHDAIFAVVSMTGDVEWEMFLGFPRGTAVQVAESFVGYEIDFDSEDMVRVLDGLVGLFAVWVETELDDCGVRAESAGPRVLREQQALALFQHDGPVEMMHFRSAAGDLLAGVVATGGGCATR